MHYDHLQICATADNICIFLLISHTLCNQVELTWDETNKDRIAVTMRKFNKEELDEMDLRDYLASDDDDDAPGDFYV